MTHSPLLCVTTDGTFTPALAQQDHEDARLHALMRLRSILGDGPDSLIATRLPVPTALGYDATDHLLPASLALLEGIHADLTSFGWRLGVGAGTAWHHARDLRDHTADAARIAYFGYEGTVSLTVLGPLTLASACWTASGERAITDRGLTRDLPAMLASGVTTHIARLRDRLPQAHVHLQVLEPVADALVTGQLRPASQRGTLPPLPAPELGQHWQSLLHELRPTLRAESVTLAPGSTADLLAAAHHGGVRRIATHPAHLGTLTTPDSRAAWEKLAELRDGGSSLEILLDPSQAPRTAQHLVRAMGELGLSPRELAGLGLIGTRHAAVLRRPDRQPLDGDLDPAQQAAMGTSLTVADIDELRRFSVALADRISS